MSERWRRYVTEGVEAAGGPTAFALSQWAYLSPVYLAMRQVLPSGGRILDIGCGAGIFTALLAHHGFEVLGIDDDPEIVSYAAEMVEFFRSPARVQTGRAVDLTAHHGQFDLAYSLGVVEHFEADQTIRLIEEQARCAPLVLVAVPSRWTGHAAPVTDERLYRRGQVSSLVRMAGLRVRRSFVFGDVPTRLAAVLRRALPPLLYRSVGYLFTYGMNICCIGERR